MGHGDDDPLDLDELFARAVEMTPEEQVKFLDCHCNNACGLRRKLEMMLEADRRLNDAGSGQRSSQPAGLAELAAIGPHPLAAQVDDDTRPIGIGTRLGPYLIREQLGQGGMANVFLAVHAELDTTAVVKVLQPKMAANDDIVHRFEREARTAARIGHPGIVKMLDAGTHASGELYILMEHLDGENLHQRLTRTGRLALATAVAFARETASILVPAHNKGVIHRDLKPENLFLVRDPTTPTGERVKLLDFGIAKVLGDPIDGGTQAGAMMGTPPYMSPEQCRGSARLDHRTDLYALGVILFEMICGVRPFNRDTNGEYVIAHATEPPPRLRALRPDVPPMLENIVSRLLAKQPDDRFSTAREVVDALARVDTSGASDVAQPFASTDAASTLDAVASTPPTDDTSARDLEGRVAEPTAETVMARSVDRTPTASLSLAWLPARARVFAVVGVGASVAAFALGSSAWQGGGRGSVAETARSEAEVDGVNTIASPLTVDREAIEAVALVGAPQLADLLYPAITASPPLAIDALRALCRLEAKEAVGPIKDVMDDYLGATRAELGACILRLGDRDALGLLAQVMEDDERSRAALIAAAALAEEDPAPTSAYRDDDRLRRILDAAVARAPGQQQWYRAASGLLALGDDRAREALRTELTHSGPRMVRAATILARHGDGAAREQLRRLAGQPGFDDRAAAALALAEMGDDAALAFIPDGLASERVADRRIAIAVATRLAPRGGADTTDGAGEPGELSHYIPWIAWLAQIDPSPKVRLIARLALRVRAMNERDSRTGALQ